MQINLEVIKGPERGRSFSFKEPDTFLVGRGKGCHFRIRGDDYISRRHFLLEIAPPKVFFKELSAANPTRINGMYKEEEMLEAGDIIEIGYTQLEVKTIGQLAERTIHCQRCQSAIQLLGDEANVTHCAACERQIVAEVGKSAPPASAQCRCGADLSAQANSDGRAAALQDKVLYRCEGCLPTAGAESGLEIGPYRTLKKLGEGGMGKVYLAYQESTARLVALKQMNIKDRQLAARFQRETRLMKQMVHDNVLCYVDDGQAQDSPYLVMEYAAGGSFDDRIEAYPQGMPVSEALRYVIAALQGLEYMHQQGIVHRDIKPENILLKRNEQGQDIPKLADFGLARQFNKAGGSLLTGLNVGMGTLLYMPPEQIKDAHNVREPADIYAMGATLYRMLTGQYPFEFPTPRDIQAFIRENKNKARGPAHALQLLMKLKQLKAPQLIVLEEPPIPIRERKADIPERLAQIVARTLEKKASDRFQTATELRQALSDF